MGDAFTALSDDSYAIYYNPAALGRTNGGEIDLLNLKVETVDYLEAQDRISAATDKFDQDTTKGTVEGIEELMDFPYEVNLGFYPSINFGPFGFSAFSTSDNLVSFENSIHPILNYRYREDSGFIFGYAHTFGSGARKLSNFMRTNTGHLFSIGGSVKYIKREQAYDPQFLGPDLYTAVENLDADSIGDIKKIFGTSTARAYGVDMGIEYSYLTTNSRFSSGLAMLDVGHTRFKTSEGDEVPDQYMEVNWGAAYKQEFLLFDYSLSFDVHSLNDKDLDIRSKTHFGLSAGLPGLKFLAGFNGGYTSYGLELRLLPFKVMAGLYGLEMGKVYKETERKRLIIYLSLLNFSFAG